MKTVISASSIIILLLCFACKKTPTSVIDPLAIDNYITDVMKFHHIPGVAIGIVKDGALIYEKYLGQASLETKETVNEKTTFQLFSTTKLITTVAVFQLIEEGKIRLEDLIVKHIDDLPVHWQSIKVKHLLTHSSGVPDFVRYGDELSDEELMALLEKDSMLYEAGDRFRYTQTNYWLLTKLIEKVTLMPFEDFVRINQFRGEKKSVYFSSNSLEEKENRATRYFYNNKEEKFLKSTIDNGRRGHSGNGLNLTLREFIKWNDRLDQNELLLPKTKKEMWSAFNFENKKDDFLYGWANYIINQQKSYGFSGGNITGFRKFVDDDLTIVFLSNGSKVAAHDILINDIARMIIPSVYKKKPVLEAEVIKLVLSGNYKDAIKKYRTLKEENKEKPLENLRWNINGIGNSFLYSAEGRKAVEVFSVNESVYPEWWVSSASIAEGYENAKEKDSAVFYYLKAIRNNVTNEWNYNDEMLKKLKELSPSEKR